MTVWQLMWEHHAEFLSEQQYSSPKKIEKVKSYRNSDDFSIFYRLGVYYNINPNHLRAGSPLFTPETLEKIVDTTAEKREQSFCFSAWLFPRRHGPYLRIPTKKSCIWHGYIYLTWKEAPLDMATYISVSQVCWRHIMSWWPCWLSQALGLHGYTHG